MQIGLLLKWITTSGRQKMATSKSDTTFNSVDLSLFEIEIGINLVSDPV